MYTQSWSADLTTQTSRAQPRLPHPVTPPVAFDAEGQPAAAIAQWLSARNADHFPYDAVVAEFHRVGKHVVATELLEALAGVRAALSEAPSSVDSVGLLERFLDTALDKWDGRYANPTYLALRLLPLPAVDNLEEDFAVAERQYDRLFVQLIADTMRFEVAAADGVTALLPQMRPDARTTAKRCRLGLQVAGPAARRLGWSDGLDVDDPIVAARRLWRNLEADLPPAERRTLQLTMLPVSVIHDEYQFIRVLQSFEATFALVAVELSTAVRALNQGRSEQALPRIRAAETRLREAAPLWSLVATMQVEAFRAFREFTEGASAIQSRNYKLVESLCRQPDPSRLDSAAYRSVPEVRQRVLAGQATLDDAFAAARDAGRLGACDIDDLEQAMRELAATLLRWRRTHYGLAARMLGERTGTGYTEGAPYLKSVQTIPVFLSLETGEEAKGQEAAGGAELTPPRTVAGVAARGRCPFAAGAVSLAMTVTPNRP